MEEILRFENVTIGYNEKDIIKDFSCTVNRGEFVSLIGPNGSGKSTLIHAITGIVGIRKGKIYINGKDNEKLSAKERAQITAVVPQTFQASFAFKAKEIVAMGRHPFLKRMPVRNGRRLQADRPGPGADGNPSSERAKNHSALRRRTAANYYFSRFSTAAAAFNRG